MRRGVRVLVGGFALSMAVLAGAGAASATTTTNPYNSQPPTSVDAEQVNTTPPTTVASAAVVQTSTPLPVTGSDVEELSLIGGGLVLAGGVLVMVRRRRGEARS